MSSIVLLFPLDANHMTTSNRGRDPLALQLVEHLGGVFRDVQHKNSSAGWCFFFFPFPMMVVIVQHLMFTSFSPFSTCYCNFSTFSNVDEGMYTTHHYT